MATDDNSKPYTGRSELRAFILRTPLGNTVGMENEYTSRHGGGEEEGGIGRGIISVAQYYTARRMRYKGIKGKTWEEVKASIRRRERDCYTCGAKDLQSHNLQAGHYKPVALVGSNNRWSWDTRFIHAQCARCNGAGAGMAIEYRAHLVKDYGEAAVLEFDTSYRKTNPVKNWEEVKQEWITYGAEFTGGKI